MAIREKLQKHPAAAMSAAVLLILMCALVVFSEVKGPRSRDLSAAGKVFYSDDDGKTWFLDDPSKGSPFDHQGTQAYRAIVYRCSGGQPFVAFLAKYSDQQMAQMEVDVAHAPPGTPSRMLGMPLQDLKKPGESKWVTNSGASMTGYPPIACPDGKGSASFVSPMDADNGASR
jgi:hypothetical protein